MAKGRKFRVIVEVNNPEQMPPRSPGQPPYVYTWKLISYSKENPSVADALDEADVLGFAVNPVLTLLKEVKDSSGLSIVIPIVQNVYSVWNGRMSVKDLLIAIAFPDDVTTHDLVVLEAPQGFNLQSKFAAPAKKQCNAFEWLPKGIPPPGADAKYDFGDADLGPKEGYDTAPFCTANYLMFHIQVRGGAVLVVGSGKGLLYR